LKALELDVASALTLATVDGSSPLRQFQEGLASDSITKKLRTMQPRIENQLKPDGLLSMALRGGKNAWIVGTVDDPYIGENFNLEIKVRWLDSSEHVPDGPMCQFILCATASGWPQLPKHFVALSRELDLGRKELVQDCTHWRGTPGGHEQLMSSAVQYVIRPALCPVNLEFCLSREFAILEEGSIPGYPAGVMVVEEALPTGVSEFEGWPVPPTRWGYVRMTQTLVWHVSSSQEFPGCSNCKQVGRYGAALPQWMTPLTLIHKVCMGIIHKTLQRLIVGALPKWDEAHGPRMQNPDIKDLYDGIASSFPGVS